jgi:protein-S-isoprenylcysteine O-methyltransferase Ste14
VKSPLTPGVWLRILLWLLFLMGGLLLGLYLDRWLFPAASTSLPWHLASATAGLLVLQLMMRIARTTGRTLARLGRQGELPRLETNRLVTSGPYGCMRHPMHLGLMLFPVAVALVAGSPSFLLFLVPLEIALMVLLILTLEEQEAVHKFGDAYRDYRARVPAFNLSPACLRRLLQPPE